MGVVEIEEILIFSALKSWLWGGDYGVYGSVYAISTKRDVRNGGETVPEQRCNIP
jgi:hypothetical protein